MKPRAIRGMNDILPDVSGTWRYLESVVLDIVQSYGYEEIRLPLLEQTELFRRSIGEVTDIVEKEMYTFADRNGESLTLRPEATPVCSGRYHQRPAAQPEAEALDDGPDVSLRETAKGALPAVLSV